MLVTFFSVVGYRGTLSEPGATVSHSTSCRTLYFLTQTPSDHRLHLSADDYN